MENPAGALSDAAFEQFLERLRLRTYQVFVTIADDQGTYVREDYVIADTDAGARVDTELLIDGYCERGYLPQAWVLFAPDGHLVE